jgi:HEPN domain-containing protein
MKKSDEEIKLVKDWLKFAKENLSFARSGMKEENPPYHTISFLCQGGAEKYLKAFLIWNGWKLKKIHEMGDLLTICMDYNTDFQTLEKECALLNEYVTEGRYPGDLPFESIGKNEAIEAIEAANKIEKLVLEKIDIPFEEETDFDQKNNSKEP